MVNILVVDDHQIVRSAMDLFFKQTNDLRMVAQASDNESTIKALQSSPKTDILLLDIEMPNAGGFTILRNVKELYPSIKVLMLSTYSEEVYAINALKAGAMGFIGKAEPIETILNAIRKVAEGGIYMSEKLAERIALQRKASTKEGHHRLYKRLSLREIEVLKLLSAGKKNKAVADELGLNEKTISTYKARLLKKLNVETMVELITHSKNLEFYR